MSAEAGHSGAPHAHLLPCHSFSHTSLKSPCVEQESSRKLASSHADFLTRIADWTMEKQRREEVRLTRTFSLATHFLIQV